MINHDSTLIVCLRCRPIILPNNQHLFNNIYEGDTSKVRIFYKIGVCMSQPYKVLLS